MKHTISAIIAMAGLFLSLSAQARDKKDDNDKTKKKTALTISSNGINIGRIDSAGVAEKDDRKWSNFTSVDIGVNTIQDNTNYSDPSLKSYLKVPDAKQNADLFKLKQNKSVNVNIYPYLGSLRVLKTAGQRIYLTTGIGFQIYNFRYDNDITYTKNPSTIIMDTISFSKNKIGIDYLNIPLMVTFKTRVHEHASKRSKDTWLVYGFGITEGYNLSSWSKQISGQRGKVKVHDAFSFSDFNTCLTAEIGVENILKLYASYQVTSLYNNGLDQHPISFGVRIGGN